LYSKQKRDNQQSLRDEVEFLRRLSIARRSGIDAPADRSTYWPASQAICNDMITAPAVARRLTGPA